MQKRLPIGIENFEDMINEDYYYIDKTGLIKQLIAEKKAHALIEVDGGVTLDNAAAIIAAGADVLVAGSTVFNAENPSSVIKALKNIVG